MAASSLLPKFQPAGPAASDFPFSRRIQFTPARKPFDPYSAFSKGDFHIETLNPSYESRAQAAPGPSAGTRGNEAGEPAAEVGIDADIDFGITFRRIGAGLCNLGNTCFLNSVVQCLTYTQPLAAYLQSGKHKSSCHTAGFCALCAIQNHVKTALQSTGKSLSPVWLVKNLRCISRSFGNARQEDAHEYMVNLLESMHKCCLPYGVSSESPAAYEKSLVHKIFGGTLRNQIQCTQCSFSSDKFDPFLDLSLDIARADTLTKALGHFIAKELLDGGEKQYQCQRCKMKVRAVKQLTVHKPPNVLSVHLKRFEPYNPGQKNNKRVYFPPSLDLKPFVSGPCDGDLKYTLYGVLVHFGWSTHSGHYYCYVRTSSGMWYTLDDVRVSQVSEKTVLEQRAYMLFYVRDRRNSIPKVAKPAKESVGTVIAEKVIPTAAVASESLRVQNHLVKIEWITSSNMLSSNPFSLLVPDSLVGEILTETNVSEPAAQVVNKSEKRENDIAIVSIMKKMQSETSHLKQIPSNPVIRDLNSSSNSDIPGMQVSGPAAPVINKSGEFENAISIELFLKKMQSDTSHLKHIPNNTVIKDLSSSKSDCLEMQVNQQDDSLVVCLSSVAISGSVSSPKVEITEAKASEKISVDEYCLLSDQNDVNGEKKIRWTCEKDDIVQEKSQCVVSDAKISDSNSRTKEHVGYTMPSTCLTVSKKLFFSSLAVRRKKKHKKPRHNNLPTHVRKVKRINGFIEESSSNDQETSTSELHQINECAHLSLKIKIIEELKLDTCTFETREVARWDGVEVPSVEVLGSSEPQISSIGYVADAWDEEYDRGKKRKVRQSSNLFDGSNPFQEFATNTLQSEKKGKHHKKHWNSWRHRRRFR